MARRIRNERTVLTDMLTVHVISPANETAVAEHLARRIRACWPDVVASSRDRIDLLVGARTGADVDLLICLDLAEPRSLGSTDNEHDSVACGLIAVEIKQLDAQRFERVGNQLFAVYREREHRSVVDQARSAAFSVKGCANACGFGSPFVYALAWLTQVGNEHLRGIDPLVVGREAGWLELLGAAVKQGDIIGRYDPYARSIVRGVCDRLIARRTLSPLDRTKAERIARDALLDSLVRELSSRAGNALVRIAGHGGCGKTTALTMLAARLAAIHGGRVLVLTFHQALCGDIRAIVDSMRDAQGIIESKLCVQTATSFLLGVLDVVAEVPYTATGATDYENLDAGYESAARLLDDGPAGDTVASVIRTDPGRLEWDYVLVDEAQDWTDAERDLLCAVYGHRRIVIADGLSQLVRRQIPCDWLGSVPSAEREIRVLDDSLRMTWNVAHFANAFARAVGLADWSVVPRRDLSGGRIVIVEGELEERLPLLMAIGDAAARGNARPVDTLVCVPPAEVEIGSDGVRRSRVGSELAGVNLQVWDACEPSLRGIAPASVDSWRVVQYDSCRGLEGWATLLLGLDDLFANKVKHPNLRAGDDAVAPDLVARRWLMIPLTRAVHLLVIHVRDARSPVAAMVREAASAMPEGVVEWYSAADAARSIAPSDALKTSG